MKQVVQNYKSGELGVVEVPEPALAAGGVLVRSLYSLISTGTELMKIDESKMSLVGKARARPDQVKRVLDTAYQQGPATALKKALNRLDSYTPLGYSLVGEVVAVGAGAEEFSVGQVVSCAGNEFALHAEFNWVPVNLCTAVPDGVDVRHAAFATVGAIAMQGVRQANPGIGDTACVVGLGLVGQLVVRLLIASGVRVVGIDIVEDRCALAEKAGALSCVAPDETGIASIERVLARASGGIGADCVFLVAGGSSNEPVEMAARLARDRATVVDIGKCKLDLPWTAYYEKELDLRFSRSYGPGRYDPLYEVGGVDYPSGYVRWTERRNLACFVDLLACGDIDIEPLVSGVFSLVEAPDVYERLRTGDLRGVGYLFEYPEVGGPPGLDDVRTHRPEATDGGSDDRYGSLREAPAKQVQPSLSRIARQRGGGAPRIGFIGAGNYASSMLLPHLSGRSDVQLAGVATIRPLSALNAKRKFGFATIGTDADTLLSDEAIDAIFVVTRHSSHADLTCRALEAGKAVFVEKPLALSVDELDKIIATVRATGNDRLMVGFNRRFSPMLVDLRARFGRPDGPMVARYLVNAGSLAPDSWYRNEQSEGSRFVGEGGHFVDVVSWWIGAEPVEVAVVPIAGGGVDVVLRYADGSRATITYLVDGPSRYPKETFDVFSSGRAARLDNFRRATVWSSRRRRTRWTVSAPQKGQAQELDAFLASVRTGAPMPIPLTSLVATTRATLAAAGSVGPNLVSLPLPL